MNRHTEQESRRLRIRSGTPSFQNRKTLVFTGDSITDCDHLLDTDSQSLGNGYVRMIQEQLPECRVINQGHNGFTVFQMRGRWQEDCICHNPDVLTILAGINDLSICLCGAGGYGADGYGRHMEWLLQETQTKTHARIILMEPFLFPKPEAYKTWIPSLDTFRRTLRRLSETFHTDFVPLWDIFQTALTQHSPDELTTDGIHLTHLGHEIIARAWLNIFTNEDRLR